MLWKRTSSLTELVVGVCVTQTFAIYHKARNAQNGMKIGTLGIPTSGSPTIPSGWALDIWFSFYCHSGSRFSSAVLNYTDLTDKE